MQLVLKIQPGKSCAMREYGLSMTNGYLAICDMYRHSVTLNQAMNATVQIYVQFQGRVMYLSHPIKLTDTLSL